MLGAGTDGVLAMEDLIAGGVIIDAMIRRSDGWSLNRSATAMLEHWQGPRDGGAAGASLIEVFAADIQSTDGARNLISIGQEADIARCCQVDALARVPELDAAANELRPAVAACRPPG